MSEFLVIDASFAFRLIMPGSLQDRCRKLVTQWREDGYTLCAPTLWLYEMTSALCKAVYFEQLTPSEGRRAVMLVHKLGVQLFSPNEAQVSAAIDWTTRLQRAAAYDSFYLALAESLSCELWTADKRLYNAAGTTWTHLVD